MARAGDAPDRARAVRRVRAARRLASSPEREEAAHAAATAAALMAKHGLTEAEIAEDVIGVADDRGDALRADLARAVAAARGCTVLGNRRMKIAFRGRRETVDGAVGLYQNLTRDVEARCEMGGEGNPPPPARAAWRLFFWLGYVQAVTDRLLGRRPPKPRDASGGADAPPAVMVEAVGALERLGTQLVNTVPDVVAVLERLRTRAYDAGRMTGERAVDVSGATRPNRLALSK